MATPVIMPRQGQSVESCILVNWEKKVGDEVKTGDILFSYETDKASFEEQAPADGIILEVFFEEGDEIPVLTTVAVIGQEGENIAEFRPENQSEEPDKTDIEKKETSHVDDIEDDRSFAQHGKEKTTTVQGAISPRAKKLAEANRMSISGITGSGPGGRIIERDILANIDKAPRMTQLAASGSREQQPQADIKGTSIGQRVSYEELSASVSKDDFETKKISNIRRIIAENMLASLSNSAQLTHHMSADARPLLSLRKHFKNEKEKGSKYNININDLVCFALIRALKNKPGINAHFLGDRVRYFHVVHLGMAVDTERGLMVPTIQHADNMNIFELAENIRSVAEKCRNGSIDPELLSSTASSFTISNLGAYGVEMFTPVLNLPQAGILGINTIITRPGDTGDGIIGMIPYIGLSLTYDHRALDGAPASAFLKEVKDQIENLNIQNLI